MQVRGLFQDEINKIRRELTLMAARVEEDLGKSLSILRQGGEELVTEIKKSGEIIDEAQIKIEDMALALIATQQPVARDLREMIIVFKIAANLERIGDYGIHLAKAANKLSGRAPFRSVEHVEQMAETGQKMLKAAFSAYLNRDIETARKAAEMDDIIDSAHKTLTEEILKLMKKKPELVKAAARLLKLSGYMERMGDHITNICEGVIYMIEGRHEDLNHKNSKDLT